MAIDVYSLCPGGTGKKIKFCCPDFVGELEKIDRMLEGEQNLACLAHVEQLLQQHPDRACLLAVKGMLLRATDQIDSALVNSATFLAKHPDNTIAQAESAILTATEQTGLAALPMLHRALTGADGEISGRVYEAMGVVAQALVADGEWVAGRALLQMQTAIVRDDRQPLGLLIELNRSPQVSTLLKDEPPLFPPLADLPESDPNSWSSGLIKALAPLNMGDWPAAADRAAALAQQLPDVPMIWRSLATLRSWLGDKPGQIEALRRYASLDVPWEDAVEAEAVALLATDDPLGDRTDLLRLSFTVHDVEKLQTAFALDSRTQQMQVDPSAMALEDSPPPKALYLLLDLPVIDNPEELTLETVSRFLGQTLLFGRQTDREARLEVIGVASGDLPQVRALLGEIVGDALDPDCRQEAMTQVSASEALLQHKWRPPNGVTPERMDGLVAEHERNVLLRQWPELKLGALGGKSAREAAAQKDSQIRVAAAILVLQSWNERTQVEFDFNDLRRELGLPTLEPIDPHQTPIAELPLVRLSRVTVETMTDEELLTGYRRAMSFGVMTAVKTFARAVVQRPGVGETPERLRAYAYLVRFEENSQRALEYVQQGRLETQSIPATCASWDLLELPVHFASGAGPEISRLLTHIQSRHFQEQGVYEALMQLLTELGVVRPGAGPGVGPGREAPPSVVEGGPVEPAAGAPSKIWTPGSDQPGGSKKLWTPD